MEIFKDNCFLSVGLKEVTFFHIVRLPKGVNESLGGACGLSVVRGGGRRHAHSVFKLKRMSASSTTF